MATRKIPDQLEQWYIEYHKPEYLRIDPLVCVRKLKGRKDREIGAIICSVIAYGKVEIIINHCEWLLGTMNWKPYDFIMSTSFKEKSTLFKDFKHRFNDGADMALLLQTASAIVKSYGSVENCFAAGYSSADLSVKNALSKFTDEFKHVAAGVSRSVPKSFEYLLPSPESGSACKRLNMFLRWVIRNDDQIDLGLWKLIPTSALIMPVDTHVASRARSLKLSNRNSADWKMAEEITGHLRAIDPADPVRFDFSMCRAGMMNAPE